MGSTTPCSDVRVAILTDNDFAKVNGVTTTLRAVLTHVPQGIRTKVYTCDDCGVDRDDYLALAAWGTSIPFYPDMKMYLPPLSRFLAHARADGIDLIHLTTPGPVGLAAMYLSSRLRLPMIGSFHTDLAEYTRMLSGSSRLGEVMRTYMRWPYGRCQTIFVPSQATRRTLVDSHIEPSRIRFWTRGVSTDSFTPARRSQALRDSWGTHGNRLALLYVGRVSVEKGLPMLAPMSRRLTTMSIPHRLVIVGDGPYREELRASCPDAVYTGTLPPESVAEAMASADLFIFPSRTDTAGNVVLEAQASGLPVLVTNAGGPQENMLDGETGHVCDGPADFERHIVMLSWRDEERARLSLRAREYALTRDWDTALEPLYRAYREATVKVAPASAVTTAAVRA